MATQLTSLLLHLLFLFFLTSFSSAIPVTNNVVTLGAKPDAKTDSTKAFLAAWARACGSATSATIYVPSGRFLLKNAVFQGPCKSSRVSIRIDGTLVAPSDYRVTGASDNWLFFQHVDGVSISGGVLDGQGTGLWACKNSGKNCPSGATSLGFSNSKNIVINGLTSLNSQLYHIVFNGCTNVKHWEFGEEFTRGWSAKRDSENCNIYRDSERFKNKILGKTKQWNSGVKISDVTYEDIHGTSATEVAVKFDCSSKNPCSNIKLEDVKLTYKNQQASASCIHADGSSDGVVQPGSCL
ncbi:hypothetical protein QYF36_020768 [Acer negundo]|nr:hypothetical protein QYF36_020768 [Acer negundo]